MISPLSGLSRPPDTFKSVDLPEPDLPSKNTIPVSGNLTLTLSSAFTSTPPLVLYTLTKFFISSITITPLLCFSE